MPMSNGDKDNMLHSKVVL